MLLSGDTTQMTELAGTFVRAAGDVAALVATLDAPVHATTWTGPAAERFRTQWDTEFAPTLRRLEEALSTNATVVSQRLAALEQASA